MARLHQQAVQSQTTLVRDSGEVFNPQCTLKQPIIFYPATQHFLLLALLSVDDFAARSRRAALATDYASPVARMSSPMSREEHGSVTTCLKVIPGT